MEEKRAERKYSTATITTWEKNEMRHRKGRHKSTGGYMKNEAKEEGQSPHQWGRNEHKLPGHRG